MGKGIRNIKEIDMQINMVDGDKLNELHQKREKLVFESDKEKLDALNRAQKIMVQIVKIDTQILKEKKGKPVYRKKHKFKKHQFLK